MAHASGVETRRSRIAVVDDDRNIAVLLAYNLEAVGYHVTVIGSGEGAEHALACAEPDLVILDWELPGLSGIEVLRRLRRCLGLRHVPVIMLTGRSDRDDRIRAFDLGADVFMSKPFALRELMLRIHALLMDEVVSTAD